MKIRLFKLQDNNKKAKKLKSEKLLKNREDIKEVLYYQNFLYVSKVIYSKFISKYYINLPASHF